MIDPASDAASSPSGRSQPSCDVPPQLPPPLPPALPGAGTGAQVAVSRRPGRKGSGWKWVVFGFVALGGIGIVVSQTIFSSAQSSSGTSTIRPGRTESGVRHWNDRIARAPWSIHVVEIDRSRTDLDYEASIAGGRILGVSRISEMARAFPRAKGKPIAIVNGDFYERDNRTYAGDPRGLQITDGELISAPSTAAVWFDVKGNPQVGDVRDDFLVTWPNGQKLEFSINQQRRANMAVLYTPTYGDATRVAGGRDLILEKVGDGPWLPLRPNESYQAKVREVSTTGNLRIPSDVMVLSIGAQLLSKAPEIQPGDVVKISTKLIPDLAGVKTAIAGGPALIQGGKPFVDREPPDGASGGYSERSKYERHPRSAIGWNDQTLFLITVDGRQPGLSVGMTLAELADYMFNKLKCTDGMNFDGGASASLWMSGSIVSDPCQGERAVANGLMVYRKDGGQ